MDASKGEGGAVRKRQEMERQAEANKAFSHFKW
jgi:small subunit ribosomal protein S7